MPHNLSFGPEADAQHALEVLRESPPEGAVESGVPLVPGIFVALDPESATRAEAFVEPGAILGVRIESTNAGRWAGLHIALGPVDLSNHHVLGFVVQSRSPKVTTFRAALRSGREGGFDDCFFSKQIMAYGENSIHVDLVQIARHPDMIPLHASWRELIFFLPPEGCELVFQDLRIFIV